MNSAATTVDVANQSVTLQEVILKMAREMKGSDREVYDEAN
jgi:hypothetical protein